MDVEKEGFRKRFPKLAEELNEGMTGYPSDEFPDNTAANTGALPPKSPETKKKTRSYDGYDPTAVDFIRRCGSEKEAQEIIDYLEHKGEIGRSEAQKMRHQLRSQGLRSFGVKKEYGYYLKSLE